MEGGIENSGRGEVKEQRSYIWAPLEAEGGNNGRERRAKGRSSKGRDGTFGDNEREQ